MTAFLQQLWQLVRPHQARLWLGLLAGAIYSLSNGAMLFVVKLVCDVLFPAVGRQPLADELARLQTLVPAMAKFLDQWLRSLADGERPMAIYGLVGLVPLVMAFRGLGTYLSFYWMSWVATAAVHDLRVRLFSHLQRLSLDFFGGARTGDLVSRVTNDVGSLHLVVSTSFTYLVREPFTLLVLVTYLLWNQPRLTAVSLVVFPLCLIPIIVYGRKVRRSWRAAQTHTAELGDVMQETFTGQRVIKAYNMESAVVDRFSATSRRIASQFMRFVRASEIPGPLIEFGGALGVALLFAYVARAGVGGGRMTSGDFFSFIGSLFMMYQPVKNLSKLWSQFEQGRGAMSRVDELLFNEPTVFDPVNPKPVQALGADVVFEGVHFRYADRPILQGIDLRVRAGTFVALVGATGSGKTTLTSLLLRFYDPERGRVLIGTSDVREVGLRELRDQIAVVTQETILFNESIRENIRLGRPSASDAEVESAARHAHADAFIREKQGGYDFVVGERGASLSGGQRQRLALARAILKNAPILILDEATSSLDSETERLVQSALDELTEGRTTLCIAHRLSTIQNADWIVVMEQGRLVEQGRHEDLLASGGVYSRLHSLQFAV